MRTFLALILSSFALCTYGQEIAYTVSIEGPTSSDYGQTKSYTAVWQDADNGFDVVDPPPGDEYYWWSVDNVVTYQEASYAEVQWQTSGWQMVEYEFYTWDNYDYGASLSVYVYGPDPPTAMGPTNIMATSFTANWTIVPSATGYELDVSTEPGFSSFVSGYSDLWVSGTSQKVHCLSPGTTYYYRVRTTGGGTSANSNVVSALTTALPVPSPATGCNPGNVTLSTDKSGYAEYAWYNQSGTLLGSTTANSFSASTEGLTSYTVKVKDSNGCWSGMSSSAAVTTFPQFNPGTIYDPGYAICSSQDAEIYGDPASGGNGTPVYQWQQDLGGGFSDIYAAGGDQESYTIPAGTIAAGASRTYRRLAKTSTSCPSDWVASNPVTVSAATALVSGGGLQSEMDICTGSSPGALTPSPPSGGGGGYSYKWYAASGASDPNDPASWSYPLAYTETYDPGPLSSDMYFKRGVTSSCGGTTKYTNYVLIDVGTTSAGTISSPTPGCYVNGTSVSLTASGNSDPIIWQQCTSGCTSDTNWSNMPSNTYGPLTVDIQFRGLLNNELCGIKYTDVVQIKIDPGPASTQPMSALYNTSATLTATGASVNETYKWYDPNNAFINCTGQCSTVVLKDATTVTYYATILNTVTGCETPYSQKTPLTINLYLDAPPAPTFTSNSCGPKTVTMPDVPEITWYWVGTDPNGQITSQPVDPSYSFSSSGPYYIRGKADGAPLWSPARELSETATKIDPVDLTITAYDPSLTLIQATHSITLSASGGGFTIPAGSTFTAKIAISPECNDFVNWTESTVYDHSGVPVSSSKSYYDGLGKSLIDESIDYLSKKVFASQPIYNTYGVSVATTLPAPILENDYIFKNNFVRNEDGDTYSAGDFDLRANTGQPGEVNNPKPLGEQPGTVGWYYSSSNDLEPYTAVTDYPYSRSYAPEGPDPTTSKSAGVGDAHRMGSGHEVTTERQLISSSDLNHYLSLRSYFVTSSLPVTGYKHITTDPDGKQIVSFVDADGRTLASATLNGTTFENWSYSYYNDLGQLVASVAPNGVNTASTDMPQFVTLYKYDQLGRLIETTSPDEGTSQFVYSTDGKIRFSQNEVQRTANPARFSYTNYDYLGRLIESGEYTTGTFVFEPHSITGLPASNSVLNIIDEVGIINATGQISGLSLSRKITAEQNNCSDYTFIEYDREDLSGITNPPTAFQTNLDGQVSRTENENAVTLYSYDEFGQVIKTWQLINIPQSNAVVKTVDYTYDYFGNVTEVAYQKDDPSDRFYHHYVYDVNQRLIEVYTSKDGTNKTLRAKYEYYLHGPLKRVELHNDAENIQGIDYTYTIDGSLKTINNADPALDPGGDGTDVFGETLHYFDNDYRGADNSADTETISGYSNQYSGLLKGMSWHSPADNNQGKYTYAYQYDNRNQLSNAVWGSMIDPNGAYNFTPAESPEGLPYQEAVPGYDKNGNIQNLTRNGKEGSSLANFDYDYELNTNRLDLIKDAGTGQVLMDYSYNSIGQMTRQIEGTSKDFEIKYNAYGLVKEVVNKLDANNILQSYKYDDRGNLLQKILYQGGAPQLYTTYVNDVAGNVLAIYQSASAACPAEATEVPVYGAGRFAVYKPAVNTYFYEVSDHLGNVRAVIGRPETEIFSTDFEATENVAFQNYSNQFDDLMDHTDAGTVYNYSQLLIAGYNSQIGLAKSLEVSPGDVIKVEAYGKYRDLNTNPASLAGFAATLTSAFDLTAGMPGEAGLAYDALHAYGTIIEGGSDHSEDPNAPKAYLNIILFDKNHNFVDAAYKQLSGTAEQVGTSVKAPHDYLVREVTVTEPGYAYIFLSNENLTQVDVHFDDVTITHTHSNIVAGADYYPFGLAMENREISAEPYRYGYQGQFAERDLTTGMQEFELRMYDPRIGRWLSPDPYGQFASPYLAMGNMPHIAIDPTGGVCPPPCTVWDAALKSYVFQEAVTVSANAISLSAIPIVASVVGYNMAGGPIFKGADDGLYSMAPSMTGNRYYQAIDDQWQFIVDEGLKREQYARDLSATHDLIAETTVTAVSTALTLAPASFLQKAAARPVLNVASTEIRTTLHGVERIAGSAATRGGVLSQAEIISTKSIGRQIAQSDGAKVFIHEVSPGRFNVVVEGSKGVITTMKNWSLKSIKRIAKNYGWNL